MNEETTSKKENRRERFILWITSATSYSFPFLTTLPNLTWWMGIMTLPFFLYIYLILFGGPEYPIPLPNLANPAIFVITTCVIITVVFLVWSIVNLHRNKVSGLVTGGPYRYVRHPQYLAFIILTGVMTLQSVWILQSTFGIGWFTAINTQIFWLVMLTSYTLIAKIEEMYLKKKYSQQWSVYKENTGYFFPGIKSSQDTIEILIGIILPIVVLQILLWAANLTGSILL